MNSQTLSNKNYLTIEEYNKLTLRLSNLLPFEPRNVSLIALAMHTGARCEELIQITPADLDPKAGTVQIKGLKGSYDRELPIPNWLMEALLNLPENPRLFGLTNTSTARRIWYRLRPSKKKFHCLRHTKAMRLLAKTKDPAIVKTWLGHKSFESTNVYISHLLAKDHMRQGLEE